MKNEIETAKKALDIVNGIRISESRSEREIGYAGSCIKNAASAISEYIEMCDDDDEMETEWDVLYEIAGSIPRESPLGWFACQGADGSVYAETVIARFKKF